MESSETNKYFLPVSVILAGLFIAGAVIWNGQRPFSPGTLPPMPSLSVDIKNVKTAGNPFIGNSNAPVTIAVWGDFQCVFCKAFEVGGVARINTPAAMPEIIKNYVDTGKVKIVFMDFAFLGPDSTTAALYSRSIWELYPNLYFEWRTKMYEAMGEDGFGGAESIDKLNATIPGIDASKVIADIKANAIKYQAQIDADKIEAQKVGIDATPSAVIGTQVVRGALPFPIFQAAIDALLK